MNRRQWLILLFFIYMKTSTAEFTCNETDNCTCYEDDPEIQCPANSTLNDRRFVIHIKNEYTTQINCYKMFSYFPMDLLPNVTLKIEKKLELNDCPLPSSFKKISQHFSMDNVTVVQFQTAKNVNLTKDYFCEMNLERVKLNQLDFVYLDQQVFENNSNLLYLEMERNENLKLTPKIFQNLMNLKSLGLAKNGLQNLPDGIFENLKSLKMLDLWGNNLTEINENIFSPLSNLTSLDIQQNKIENISESAFQNLRNLSSVNLSENRIKTLSPNIFKNNQNLKKIFLRGNIHIQIPDFLFADLIFLEEVQLSYNKLEKISLFLFQGLKNLKIVDLEKNLISEIDNKIFRDLHNLEKIILKNNLISKIDPRTFYKNPNLIIVDLSDNQYSGDDNPFNILEEATNVQKLDLSHNLVTRIENILSPHSLSSVEILDLRYNHLTEIWLTDLQSPKNEMTVKLDHNNITKINFENIDLIEGSGKSIIDLGLNPIECSCKNFELLQFLKTENDLFEIVTEDLVCGGNLEDQKFEKLSPEQLICGLEVTSSCPSRCVCHWRPLDKSVVIDCSFKNLTEFPVIDHRTEFVYNQTELRLEGNDLEVGPNKSLNYENVTKLYLSGNRIKELEWIPTKLEVLRLDNNKLTFLNNRILDSLNNSHLQNLSLNGNGWICDCRNAKLTNFLREHSRNMNFNNIFCNNSTTLLLNLSESDLCLTNLVFYILLPTLTFFLILATLLVLFYRYQKEIKVWLFAHDLCLWWVTEEELDKDKIYDAFISYSHKDENFILEELVPALEGSPNPYKLCLHFRDFVPGEFISTQVTNSVLESRRTLVVLSKNFLESVWGKMEFRTAHCQAMTDGRARVIILLYGNVEVEKLDDELKAYLKTNTYVKWGDKYFWDQLRYALPHSKRRVMKNEQKNANVMRCIDDKFNLVVEKLDPGTTPPALALDSSVLKKHPLDLVSREEVNTPPAEAGSLVVSTYG